MVPRIVAVAVLIAVAWTTNYFHKSQPLSEPESTVGTVFGAFSRAEVDGVQQAAMPGWFNGFVGYFGEAKYRRVVQAFDRVARLGRSQWFEVRRRAEAAASQEYSQLRERVHALGTEARRRLPSEEAFRLIQDPEALEAFRWRAGVEALPAEDRKRVGSPEDLRTGNGFGRFVENEAWGSLPESDRTALGSQAALATADTPEKLAYLDRVGLPLASDEIREELKGVMRQELQDAITFKFKYGRPLAEQYLKTAAIPADLRPEECVYPAQESGSLMKGIVAYCSVRAATPRGDANMIITLLRIKRTWLVSNTAPMPYEVW